MDVQTFLSLIFSEMQRHGIDVTNYQLDHLCYRVATIDLYQEKNQELAGKADLLSEALIGGRPIASWLLREPIVFQNRCIHVIEVPAPKPGTAPETGWEHVEFVIPEGFAAFLQNHAHLPFDTSGLHKAHNPEVALKLGPLQVKFHLLSLQDAIRREKA